MESFKCVGEQLLSFDTRARAMITFNSKNGSYTLKSTPSNYLAPQLNFTMKLPGFDVNAENLGSELPEITIMPQIKTFPFKCKLCPTNINNYELSAIIKGQNKWVSTVVKADVKSDPASQFTPFYHFDVNYFFKVKTFDFGFQFGRKYLLNRDGIFLGTSFNDGHLHADIKAIFDNDLGIQLKVFDDTKLFKTHLVFQSVKLTKFNLEYQQKLNSTEFSIMTNIIQRKIDGRFEFPIEHSIKLLEGVGLSMAVHHTISTSKLESEVALKAQKGEYSIISKVASFDSISFQNSFPIKDNCSMVVTAHLGKDYYGLGGEVTINGNDN